MEEGLNMTIKIKDVLERDPSTQPLVNQGQARLDAFEELKGELQTFVCEGQYVEGIQRIINAFLYNGEKPSQQAAWVSGFFGSGKSHLLKMLTHLWQDTPFPDGSTARSLVPILPSDLRDLFRELDTAGKRTGGILAAAGSLPSGITDQVRLTVLGVILSATGLPKSYPQARFCLWLHANGHYEGVKKAIEAAGRGFDRELNNLYVSPIISKAVIESIPGFANTEAEAKQLIKAEFPSQTTDIATEQFLSVAKEALLRVGKNGRMPCTILVLDEVQQYIGQSNDRSVLITEVAEAVSKQMDSQVMIVAAGQSALTDIPLLQKLMDRFTIRVPLSDAEVESVTRKVLLLKKADASASVKKVLEDHAGEVSRQLQGTGVGEVSEDRKYIVDDYPLLPVRRRFWEHCFRQIDAAGTHSQLRSQLRIVHDAVAKIASKDLGAVVTGDELFSALAPEMVNTGVLLREINERIIQVGKDFGPLAQRVCGLIFLIWQVKRDGLADIGVRATKDHIADLLVDDLCADNGKLRNDVEGILLQLSEKGLLMKIGDEYRLQTREGSEWDAEFRNRQAKLNNDDAAIQFQRDQLLYAEADRIIRSINLIHGAAKEARQMTISRDQTPPPADGMTIPVWIRDGWSSSDKDMRTAAQSAGTDSPLVFVFVQRQSAEDLRRLIVDAEAAQQTLNARGNPSSDEGIEARRSMESRRSKAVADRDSLVREIIASAKVYQGGGSELLQASLDARIKTAAEASLIRLFPRFREADSQAWESVIKRARSGADQPFQPAGHTDATEKHPVCQQVIATIGAGKTGSEIRKILSSAPFGWPKDAIDAALIALHRSENMEAKLNGASVVPGQLDQNKIPKTEFRLQQIIISVKERLVIRGLFTELGIQCKSGEESVKSPELLTTLIALARSVGGDAPLPLPPSVTEIEDLHRLIGNEQLKGIINKADDIKQSIKKWGALVNLIKQRMSAWILIERLEKHARNFPGTKEQSEKIAAIREQRLLLQPTDPVAPIRGALAGTLREEITKLYAGYEEAYQKAIAELASNNLWNRLSQSDQEEIIKEVGIVSPVRPDVSTDDALANQLDVRPLSGIRTEIAALPALVAQAIEQAARKLEPKVRAITIEKTTLRSEDDVNAWVERQRVSLLEAVKKGPVLIK
jgi:hypothetical protein